LHLDYTKVIILILWWRNFQLEYWRNFQLVSTRNGCDLPSGTDEKSGDQPRLSRAGGLESRL